MLGRSFSYAVLRNVGSHAALVDPGRAGPGEAGDKAFDEGLLQIALGRLLDADLLFVEGVPPEAIYRFKHALIRDSAYDSLLKSRRQTLHRRAAEALIEVNEEPEAVARHFTEAGLDDLAIEWWSKAGEDALRRSAYKEAIAHLGRAIANRSKATSTSP